ncbi:MAG: hypothetical protein IT424_03080 [Pirellulales bacterium]|nr:hypothetical protein [Pirellulales bacterium]
MRRCLLTIAIVAAISGWIAQGERAAGRPRGGEWIRTAQGWESRRVLAAAEIVRPPAVHPAVVAGLQLGASLFVLIALPSRVKVVRCQRAETAAGRRGAAARGVKPLSVNA